MKNRNSLQLAGRIAGFDDVAAPVVSKSSMLHTGLGLPQTPIETAIKDSVNWFRPNGYT